MQIKSDTNNEPYILTPVGAWERVPAEYQEDFEGISQAIVKLVERYQGTVFVNGPCKEKAVYLTFDDAPDKRYTPLILDVLKAHHVKASFFIHGRRAERLKNIVQRIAAEGHYIGNHTYTHPDLTQITEEEIRYEVEHSSAILKKITGKDALIMRPPYGEVNEKVISEVKKVGKTIMLWSLDTFDWIETKPDQIVKNVVDYVRPGEVILLHSYQNKRATFEALGEIIRQLKVMGYKFLTVEDFIKVEVVLKEEDENVS